MTLALRDAVTGLIAALENCEVHHRRPRHLTKEQIYEVFTALYEVTCEYGHQVSRAPGLPADNDAA